MIFEGKIGKIIETRYFVASMLFNSRISVVFILGVLCG